MRQGEVRQGKAFFSEEKKQKTFDSAVARLGQTRAHITAHAPACAVNKSRNATSMVSLAIFCFAVLAFQPASAEDTFYDVRVSVHPDVSISVYNDGRITWNTQKLASPVALEAKSLSASQQRRKPFLALVQQGNGTSKFAQALALLHKYGFHYVLTQRPAGD